MSLHTTPRGAAWPLALPGMAVPAFQTASAPFCQAGMVGEAAIFNACARGTCGRYSFTAPVIAET